MVHEPSPTQEPTGIAQPLTAFGAGLDALAVETGGWPSGAIVHTVMVLNPGIEAVAERKQIELKGAVPKGANRNGRPVFGPRSQDYRVVVTLAQYRAAITEGRSNA